MPLVEDLGRCSYERAWARQRELLDERIQGRGQDTLLLVEHDPVITLGRRRSAASNVLSPGDLPVLQVERGGDVTWHGPGQLVAYPVWALPEGRRDLHRHLRELEEAVIRTCSEFGLRAERDERNTGAWIDGRKVCSVGIACRRWVCYHGLALNVAPDLAAFSTIHPCGFEAGVMTSMEDALGEDPGLEAVKPVLARHLLALLP